MFFKLIILSSFIVFISVLGLSINLLLKKGGKFPATSVGKNKEMKKRGITCARQDELKCHCQEKKDEACTIDCQ
jgi:hypothetical protein